jgi:excisionase family DNA binding protein
MGKVFLTINEISEYLNLKRSTVYSMVEAGEVPYYRIGRLIRFKQDEVDRWMDEHGKGCVDVKREVKRILKGTNQSRMDIDRVVKKTIEEIKDRRYTSPYGKPDQIESLRKEVKDGTL